MKASIPAWPPKRPYPDDLTPPKGIWASSCTHGPLTWQMPDSIRLATCQALELSLPNTAAARPNSLSLAQATASSTPFTRTMALTGAKVSSRKIRMAEVTWSSRVAGIRVSVALPPHTSFAPLASASSIISLHRSTVDMSTTEPSTTGPSRGSPSGRLRARSASFATNDSATASSTTMRSADMQICPELAKAEKVAAATAASMSASSRTTNGALPPSSSTTCFRCFAQVPAISLPTLVDPVKFTRRSAG